MTTPAQKTDGKFYTKGRSVWKRPLKTLRGETATMSCGFKVCQLDDYCPDEAAEMIASALNATGEIERLQDALKDLVSRGNAHLSK